MALKKQLSNLFIFGIPLLLIVVSVFLATKITLLQNPIVISNALVFDFVLTIPLVYFLLIRKTTIPKLTIVPLFTLGLLLASRFIPVENQQYLELVIKYVFPIVELGVFVFVISNLYTLVKEFRKNKGLIPDFYDNLKHSASSVLPSKLSSFFATEISVLYYGFIHWREKKLKEHEFSYHKNSGSVGLFFGLLLIIGVEMSVVHIMLAKWSSVGAWVLTGLSVYSSVQIFGFLKSVIKRPTIIEKDKLHLKYGVLSETIIPLQDIEFVEYSTKSVGKEDDIQYLSLLKDLEPHNIILQTKKENSISGLYGMKRKYTRIVFYVDTPTVFLKQLDKNRKAL